uniref:Nucleolar protein 14 n=1 Tax=Ciona savignyi TaxID=51511 RepID=H2YBE1_CIOSA
NAMAKHKKGISDRVRKSKQHKKSLTGLERVKNNPFEIKINKQKHTILGRKTKNDRGLPGVSRSKANKKRKETLLTEYSHRNKTNQFRDARIGVNDEQMSVEEKMLHRFSLERKKKHEKMAQFNLNDDEELTHLGRSLSTMNKFDDFEESDNEDGPGGTISEYVENAHFGGGIFTKKTSETNNDEMNKTRKEVIEDIIAKSKLAKYEKKAAKEKSDELRDKLDDAWGDFQKLIKPSVRTSNDKESAREKSGPDDYDLAVKQMLFDRKATPSEKQKTEEQLREEQQALLRKQEEERLSRMQMAEGDGKKQRKHQSADALEDDYVREPVEHVEPLSFNFDDEDQEIEDDNEQKEDEDAIDEEEDLPEDQVESELGDLGIVDDGEDSEEENDADQSDEFLDIDSGNEEDVGSLEDQPDAVQDSPEEDDGKNEVKVTNKFPASYSEFSALVSSSDLSASDVVSDLRKRFAPSIGKGNKAKMIELFAYIWQHCCTVAVPTPNFTVINTLISHAYELCVLNPENCCECVKERLKRSYYSCVQSSRTILPSFEILIQFKLIKLLYSTSDFTHPVVTPALLFMSHLLDSCKILTLRDVAKGLFICTTASEYVCFSKRFIPECVNFLTTVLSMAVPNKQHKTDLPTVASTRVNTQNFDLLVIKEKKKYNIDELKPDLTTVMDEHNDIQNTDLLRCQLVATAVRLTEMFATLYSDIPAFDELFCQIQRTCQSLKTSLKQSNPVFAKLIEGVLQTVQSHCGKQRSHISFGERKPKPLRLFDPKIDDEKECGLPNQMASGNRETVIVLLPSSGRREMKGSNSVKSGRDSRFIARHQQKEQEAMDKEREAKVKRIYGLLSNQEGDVKRIKRKKYQ